MTRKLPLATCASEVVAISCVSGCHSCLCACDLCCSHRLFGTPSPSWSPPYARTPGTTTAFFHRLSWGAGHCSGQGFGFKWGWTYKGKKRWVLSLLNRFNILVLNLCSPPPFFVCLFFPQKMSFTTMHAHTLVDAILEINTILFMVFSGCCQSKILWPERWYIMTP